MKHTEKTFDTLSDLQKLQYFCTLAHLAPSSHNTQPWRFLIDPKKSVIKIYLNRKSVLKESDLEGRQAVISIGCAIANIEIGAEYFGYNTSFKLSKATSREVLPYRPDKNQYTKIGEITFKKSSAKQIKDIKTLFGSIFTRKVSRSEFDPKVKLPERIIKNLNKLIDTKNVEFRAVTKIEERLKIAELQAQADGFVMNLPKFSKELGRYLLPNNTKEKIGMPGITFGLLDKEAIRINQGLLKGQLEPEDVLKFALGGKVFMEKSPLIGYITAKKDSISDWIAAGKAFEKIFLLLNSEGVNLAIHAGIIEIKLVNNIFRSTFNVKDQPVILFRAGYVKNKADLKRPQSPRIPIKKVILSTKQV